MLGAAGLDGERAVTADPDLPPFGTPSPLETQLPLPEGTASPATALKVAQGSAAGGRYTGAELWLHRISVLLFVFVCAAAGVLLLILPWGPKWTDNHLLLAYPGLRAFLANGFVRGVCSGLGVLDIWIGFWEAVHYHEDKQP